MKNNVMMYDYAQLVREYLKTLETRNSAEEILNYYHPEIEQIEYPNTLTKQTAQRNREALRQGAERGAQVLQKERYEVVHLYVSGTTAILEAVWTSTLAIPLGNLPVGGEMKAHFAQFFEFRDGLIYRQRNYDCFDPF